MPIYSQNFMPIPDAKDKNTKTEKPEDIKEIWKQMTPSQRYEFLSRKDLTAQQLEYLDHALGFDVVKPGVSVQATPPITSWQGIVQRAMSYVPQVAEYLPGALGAAGGLGGEAASGYIESPWLATGAKALGSAIGGGIGEVARQGIEHVTGWDDPDYTWSQRMNDIKNEMINQGLTELVASKLAGAFRPTLSKSIDKLVAAGDLGASDTENLEKVASDLMKAEKASGTKVLNIGDLQTLLNSTKREIGNTVDLAMSQPVKSGGKTVPLREAEANTNPIFNEIHDILSTHPSQAKGAVGDNPVWRKAVENRALQYAKPRTFGELTDRRIILNNRLRALYDLPKGEQRAYLLAHPNLEIDKVEADAIRDIIYPEMDRASGHPIGYTQALQNKRGAIMSLENAFQTQAKELHMASRKIGGKSIIERGNISTYGTPASGRPGIAVHRLGSLLVKPDPEAAAGRKVAKAFGNTLLTGKAAEAVTSPVGTEILSLPIRTLFAPDAPKEKDKKKDSSDVGPQSSVDLNGVKKEAIMRSPKRVAVNTPDGGVHYFPDESSAESFKKAAQLS